MVERVATRILEMSAAGVRELSPHEFQEGRFLESHGTYAAAVAP
jgi:hypothetical protein